MPSPDAAMLAVAAVLVGATVRDLLDGPDAAPPPATARAWIDPRRLLRPARLLGLVPALATAALALLVWTAPLGAWLWGVVVLVALTLCVRPLAHGRRLAARVPDAEEAAALAAAGIDGREGPVRVVETRGDQLNGYTIGGPRSDAVGVSRRALAELPPRQLAAVVAHERGHHRGRHGLVRAGASVAWLSAGALVVTSSFATMTPVATVAVVGLLAGERLVAVAVGRHTEYRADAHAARRTSVDATVALLETLASREPGRRRWLPLLSSHPTYRRRVARLLGTVEDS